VNAAYFPVFYSCSISYYEIACPARCLLDLHGVYDAASLPGLDLDPNYLRGARGGGSAAGGDGNGSPFPAQVRFSRVHDFPPLEEIKFCHLVSYNNGTNIFRHRLAQQDTLALLRLLVTHNLAIRHSMQPFALHRTLSLTHAPHVGVP